MTFTQLEYFIAIAESENMTKAATNLNVAQPALSRTMQRLENELNITLFERKGKSIVLSEQGKIFLHFAKQCLNSFDHITHTLSKEKLMNGHLRIGLLPQSPWARNAITAFLKKNPSVTMEINQIDTSADIQNFDFIIAPTHLENSVFPDFMEQTILWHEPLVLLVSKNNPLAAHHSIPLSETKSYPFISPINTDYSNFQKTFFQSVNFWSHNRVTTNNQSLVLTLVQENLGIALFPESCIPTHYKELGCEVVHLSSPEYRRTVSLFWNPQKLLGDAQKAFQIFISEYFLNQ